MVPHLSAHGADIPSVGLGTSQLGNCADIVAAALRLGVRHIDTAAKYGTEPGVGEGVRMSGVPRADIFLTTKVSHENLRAADFARSVDESLSRLQVGYVDLLLVHWPSPDRVPLGETMEALAKAKRQGKTRHVGLANFNIALLEEAARLCPEPLVTLQAEYHPYLDQSKVLAHCRSRGLILMAYCPLARGRIFKDPVLGQIARAKGKSVAQIALRWLIQQGMIAAIPRSANPAHIAETLAVFDFSLTGDEMKEIFGLRRADGRIANPAGRAPQWD